jgi:hypothetical protein
LLYDGPTESLYLRGKTTNPFANTPLAPLYVVATQAGTVPTLDLEVAVKPGGEFFLDAKGTYNIASLPESGEVLIAHNYPITGPAARYLSSSSTSLSSLGSSLTAGGAAPVICTGIYFDAKVQVFGNFADLQGKMLGNGDFSLTGSAAVHIGSLSGNAFFTLSNTYATGFVFTAALDAGFTSTYLKGGVHGDFTFGITNHALVYNGRVRAWGQVWVPGFGWQGTDIGAGFAPGDIWVSAAGYRYDFRF